MKSLLLTLGSILILAAIGLTTYNIYDDYRAKEQSENLLGGLEDTNIIDMVPVVIPMQSDSEGDIPKEVKTDDIATVRVQNYELMGEIEIPSLSIKLPLISEWSYPRLKVAPCRYSGSIENNNLILAAHNYSNHFGRLNNVPIGGEVYITDVFGTKYSYKVSSMEVINDNQLFDLVKEGPWDLTLFTCTKGGQFREVVRLSRDTVM